MQIELLPIVIALTESIKAFKIDSKWMPLVSISFGVLLGILLIPDCEIIECILQGILIGLTASGLYDLGVKPVKTVIKKIGK